jgi:hypothetical protein
MTENKITMPASYAVLNADEMMYTDGGASNNDDLALGRIIALGSVLAGSLAMIPLSKYYQRMKEIDGIVEDEIYEQTILYLKAHTDANQMLAEYEGRTTYLNSDRYKELMTEYNSCKLRYTLWGIGGCGVMLIGSLVGVSFVQS